MNKPDFGKILTIYGRKPVLEALQDRSLQLYSLHLADSNKAAPILDEMKQLAAQRQLRIQHHSKLALSRISRNSQQDQGVALDIHLPGFQTWKEFSNTHITTSGKKRLTFQLVAVDGITNPQNLGMIIRSVCASGMDGLLLPENGCARLDALVIKASAGTLFRTPIIRCKDLAECLQSAASQGVDICLLDSNARESLFEQDFSRASIFILGNESSGPSDRIRLLATRSIAIPLKNRVESLNVAVAAALVCFTSAMRKKG